MLDSRKASVYVSPKNSLMLLQSMANSLEELLQYEGDVEEDFGIVFEVRNMQIYLLPYIKNLCKKIHLDFTIFSI